MYVTTTVAENLEWRNLRNLSLVSILETSLDCGKGFDQMLRLILT